MSPRARVTLVVAVAAVACGGAVAGVAALTSDHPHATVALPPRAGAPPLSLDLGVRTDSEAVALRRAAGLYGSDRAAAGRIFARYHSVEARIGAALAAWPDGTVPTLERLVAERPQSAAARLHLGLALFWARQDAQAAAAWRSTARLEPDSASAVRADDLLHPRFPVGLPVFVPGFAPSPAVARLAPPARFAAFQAAARRPDAHAKLLYGVALQQLGRPLSAEREYAAAARLAPRDAEAQVAAAVGRFSKTRPAEAFSRLGPLSRRFPQAPTVRFHIGLLLLWLGQVPEAERQLGLAVKEGPATPLGQQAARYLTSLRKVGSG
ncbi:MAG: tetratricopeptide repeat protein [Gaiellaceae bacterium]